MRTVLATPEHAARLAPKMRQADLEEIRASHGQEALPLLLHGLEVSTTCRALLAGEDDEVAAMFGVTPVSALGEMGMAWALTGEAVDKSPIAFLRASRRQLGSLLLLWPELCCAIDARYLKAVRWARWLGFAILPPVPIGEKGVLFHPAFIRRDTWDS